MASGQGNHWLIENPAMFLCQINNKITLIVYIRVGRYCKQGGDVHIKTTIYASLGTVIYELCY